MNTVKLSLDEKGEGKFYIMDETEQVAEMVFEVKNDLLTVFHTEVLPKAEGKGLARELLTAMVEYARLHHLKVIPLCPYVHLQFRRHAEEYADVLKKIENS